MECNLLLPESYDGLLALQPAQPGDKVSGKKKADWQGLWSMH